MHCKKKINITKCLYARTSVVIYKSKLKSSKEHVHVNYTNQDALQKEDKYH